MNPVKSPSLVEKVFIDRDKLYSMLQEKPPTRSRLQEILNKALLLKGLSQREAAELLLVEDHEGIRMMMEAARIVKQEIYGRRLVLFAPLYIANACDNNCVYCGFRKANTRLKRVVLSIPEVEHEVTALLRQGHKRLLMLTGESEESPLDYFIEGLRAAYRVRWGHTTSVASTWRSRRSTWKGSGASRPSTSGPTPVSRRLTILSSTGSTTLRDQSQTTSGGSW